MFRCLKYIGQKICFVNNHIFKVKKIFNWQNWGIFKLNLFWWNYRVVKVQSGPWPQPAQKLKQGMTLYSLGMWGDRVCNILMIGIISLYIVESWERKPGYSIKLDCQTMSDSTSFRQCHPDTVRHIMCPLKFLFRLSLVSRPKEKLIHDERKVI